MVDFRMPSLGADMESGTLTEWLVKPGDRVRRGDVVAVVETDKGAIEVEIFVEGIVTELTVPIDTLVLVGAVLARLDTTAAGLAVAPAVTAVAPAAPVTPSVSAAPAATHERSAIAATSRRKVSPAARQHARQQSIDLDTVDGTGPGGIVNVGDVERAVAARGATKTAVVPKKEPVTGAMRRAIGAAMSRSKREIPHYYLAHGIDLEPALRWMERRNAERPIGQRLLYGALLVKAVARAVTEAPELNGYWRNDTFEACAECNVGIVIALRRGGLAAPALRDVANTSVDAVMAALRDLSTRARAGRLRSSELGSATVTVSSLGETGVETVFPVIHPPQVAIVGFGAVLARPWALDGGLHVRRVVQATLAADHRASDGQTGARFLAALERWLAKPDAL